MKSIRKNTFFNFILSFSSILFPFITMPYISRVLVINDIGLLNKGTALYALFVNLASFGFAGYGAREIARNKDNKEKMSALFSSVLTCHLVTIFFLLFVYCFYVVLFIPASERLIHVLYIFLFAITPFSIEWFYIGREDFNYIALRSVLVKVILLILVFTLVHNSDDFVIYAIIFVAAQGINFLFNIVHARKFVNFSLKKVSFLKTFSLSKYFYFQTLVAVCYQNINQIILGNSEVQLALFVRATTFSTLIAALISPISNAVKPRLEYLITKDDLQYKQYINNAFDCILSILCPAVLGMVSLSNNITLIFGGEQFASGAVVLIVCCVGAFSSQLATFLNCLISTPAGFEKNTFYSNSLVAVVALVLNPILIWKLGALGAAFSVFIAETVGVIFHFILIKKNKLYTEWLAPKKSKYFFSSVIMMVALLLIKKQFSNIYIQCIIGIACGVIVYMGCLFLFTKIFRDSKPYIIQFIISYIKGRLK